MNVYNTSRVSVPFSINSCRCVQLRVDVGGAVVVAQSLYTYLV